MEIPSIQLSLEHIEELDFTCPAAKKSINIGKEIIPVTCIVIEYINRVDERNVGTTYTKYSIQKLSVTSDKCIRNINFHEYNRF